MASQKERRVAPRNAGPRSVTKSTISNEEIYRLIAESAYFKAKARNFEPGGEVQDWIEAEAEVKDRLHASPGR